MIRREFLKVASTAIGAVTFAPWVLEREAAAAAEVDAVKSAFAEAALTRARVLGASYADIRINRYRSETIFTRERQVQNVARNQDFGFGVRVLVNGTCLRVHALEQCRRSRVRADGGAVARVRSEGRVHP